MSAYRTKKEQEAYDQGYYDALKKVHDWLDDCATRNVKFQVEFPKAPEYQRLTAKYAALTQENHVLGLKKMMAKQKEKLSK